MLRTIKHAVVGKALCCYNSVRHSLLHTSHQRLGSAISRCYVCYNLRHLVICSTYTKGRGRILSTVCGLGTSDQSRVTRNSL